MRYPTAAAFRRALEYRLKSLAGNDPARLARYRKRVVFDRLLARLVTAAPTTWVLKGGFALDLRLADRARTTKDVDLAWRAEEHDPLDALLDAAGRDLDDYFVFSLERADTAPDLLGGAHRFRVTASLAGRPFEAFVLDVGTHEGPFAGEDLLASGSGCAHRAWAWPWISWGSRICVTSPALTTRSPTASSNDGVNEPFWPFIASMM